MIKFGRGWCVPDRQQDTCGSLSDMVVETRIDGVVNNYNAKSEQKRKNVYRRTYKKRALKSLYVCDQNATVKTSTLPFNCTSLM